jgi:hypothetical protein
MSTQAQQKTWDRGSGLVCIIRRFYMALFCQQVGSWPFSSPIISFCAMLSRKRLRNMSSSSLARGVGAGTIGYYGRDHAA